MDGPILIHGDLPCHLCAYNLRGLSLDAECPECGTPVGLTVQRSLNVSAPAITPLVHAAHRAKVSFACIRFVAKVLRQASIAKYVTEPAEPGKQQQLNAREVAAAVAELAEEYSRNRDGARRLLEKLGIQSSADLGRIVFAMVEAGLLQRSPEDRIEDFDGLFTLDSIFNK